MAGRNAAGAIEVEVGVVVVFSSGEWLPLAALDGSLDCSKADVVLCISWSSDGRALNVGLGSKPSIQVSLAYVSTRMVLWLRSRLGAPLIPGRLATSLGLGRPAIIVAAANIKGDEHRRITFQDHYRRLHTGLAALIQLPWSCHICVWVHRWPTIPLHGEARPCR